VQNGLIEIRYKKQMAFETGYQRPFCKNNFMGKRGLEPLRLSAHDPKAEIDGFIPAKPSISPTGYTIIGLIWRLRPILGQNTGFYWDAVRSGMAVQPAKRTINARLAFENFKIGFRGSVMIK